MEVWAVADHYTWFSDTVSLDPLSGQCRKISYPRWIALAKAGVFTNCNRKLEQPVHTLTAPTA